MSDFTCMECRVCILDSPEGYITGCKHYPVHPPEKPEVCGGHKPLGQKFDQGKLRWSLLPLAPVREIIKALMFGTNKYSDNNWMEVVSSKGGADRYYDALMRHMAAFKEGERSDADSGLPHLAHAGCCLLFLLWFEIKGGEHGQNKDR